MSDAVANQRRSIPISALEHHAYCPRQAVLIHGESYFDSSVDTVRGDLAHAAVDRAGIGRGRDRSRVFRSLPVWSDEVGLHGVCDVVQFDADGPVPIEHKSGGYRAGGPADVQVAAQALCLREMFGAAVPTGVVFAGNDRRRHEVRIDNALANRVRALTTELRELLDEGVVPAPVNDSRCRRCSLLPGCMPDAPRHVQGLFIPRPEGTWRD